MMSIHIYEEKIMTFLTLFFDLKNKGTTLPSRIRISNNISIIDELCTQISERNIIAITVKLVI